MSTTVTNRKIKGKTVYFEVGPSGIEFEIDKDEYDKKLEQKIRDFKLSQKNQKKSRGGTVTMTGVAGATVGGGEVLRRKKKKEPKGKKLIQSKKSKP